MMISYLKGEVTEITANSVILEVQNIGYEIFMPQRLLGQIFGTGNTIKVHTYFHVREDAMQLYGFLNKEDLAMFKLLLNVNGIGPRAGLGIISTFSANDIRFAVLADDAATIAKAPGIGKKTASKLVLELKDKFNLEEAFEMRLEQNLAGNIQSGIADRKGEAIQALVALGYSSADAIKAVKQVENMEALDTEQILKAALKKL